MYNNIIYPIGILKGKHYTYTQNKGNNYPRNFPKIFLEI